MARADLAGWQRAPVRVAEFVQLAQCRDLDEILRVPEEIHDGHHAEADAGGSLDETRQIAVPVRVPAGDARQAGVGDGVLQMQVQLLVSPIRIAG